MSVELKRASTSTALAVSCMIGILAINLILPAHANFDGKFPGVGSKSDWERASALVHQGNIKLGKQDFIGAEKLYRESIKIYPSEAVEYDQLAHCLAHAKKFDEAADVLKKSISIEPVFSNWNNLGVTYMFQGKYSEANSAFSNASKLAKTPHDKRVLSAALAELKKRQVHAKVTKNGQ